MNVPYQQSEARDRIHKARKAAKEPAWLTFAFFVGLFALTFII